MGRFAPRSIPRLTPAVFIRASPTVFATPSGAPDPGSAVGPEKPYPGIDGAITETFPPIRRFAERSNNFLHWWEVDRGGHFPAMEQPELLLNDVTAFFRPLR